MTDTINHERAEALKPFQITGAEFLSVSKRALLCDQMRMGKSPQSIVAADLIKAKKILISCPASVKLNWVEEFAKWSDMKRSVDVVFGQKAKISKKADVTIINYELVTVEDIYKQFMDLEFDVYIPDEFHYLKGMESQRTECVLLRGGISSRAKRHWGLSGTPMLNRPIEIFPITQCWAPELIKPYNSYKSFAQHFCGGYYDTTTRKFFDKGATHKKELMLRLNSGFMLRRLRKDHLDELPKREQIIPIQPDRKVQKLMAEEFNWSKGEVRKQDLSGDDHIATLRRKMGLAKVPYIIRHARYLLKCEKKIVLFGFSKDVMKLLYHHLKEYNPAMIGGGMGALKKKASEKKFNTDSTCRIMLAQIYAAAEGLDFSVCSTILFGELDWTYGKLEQAGDRCSGILQNDSVLVQFMVWMGSLDEHQLRTVIDKKEDVEDCIEDDENFSELFG